MIRAPIRPTEIRATHEAFALAAFLLRTLPEEHHAELRVFVPEASVMQWVAARRRLPRKELAEALATRWKISRASAYRCLACIDFVERQRKSETAAA